MSRPQRRYTVQEVEAGVIASKAFRMGVPLDVAVRIGVARAELEAAERLLDEGALFAADEVSL